MPTLWKPQSTTFDYDDIILVPNEGIVKSRAEVDTGVLFGDHTFNLPVVPANMSTIVDANTCKWLATRGYFYIMHRFDVDAVAFIKDMHDEELIASISFGIKEADYKTLARLVIEDAIPEYVTVDVAHGDSAEVHRMVRALRRELPGTHIIAGNVATAEAAIRLVEAGANSVKTGVAPGSACLTAPNTGFGSRFWQLSAVADVAEALKQYEGVQVIADGGIRHYGDIAKSVAFGADMVMIGGMFAGHDENPGAIIETPEGPKKEFFGSASEYQKGETKHVEGKRMLLPYKGSLEITMVAIKENLQSSVSYAGGNKLEDLHDVSYVIVK